jgi:hypothetical protein
MLKVLTHSWPLLMGVMLLMVGNGMQGTLLGIRGTLRASPPTSCPYVMSAYFLGFLFGSGRPGMIRQVGHVRVFAALGSLISAVLVLYPMLPRLAGLGADAGHHRAFCFSGIYITAESWLNNTATNETRGQALSAYMIVQMLGIIASQVLLNLPDPSGFALFMIPSVLVSLAFMPILLAPTPAPDLRQHPPAGSFREPVPISPLGCVGMLLTGGIFSAMFGMASVWGAQSLHAAADLPLHVGALCRRAGAAISHRLGLGPDGPAQADHGGCRCRRPGHADRDTSPPAVSGACRWRPILGGITNPIYSLLIAYTNDFLPREQMAAASAGLIFLNGFGAIFGPTVDRLADG